MLPTNLPKDASTKEEAQKQAVSADVNAEARRWTRPRQRPVQIPIRRSILSHALNFIVTAGASINPNWILSHSKGPANIGNLASIGGVRTHTLDIAGIARAPEPILKPIDVLQNDAFRQAVQSP